MESAGSVGCEVGVVTATDRSRAESNVIVPPGCTAVSVMINLIQLLFVCTTAPQSHN